MVNKKATKSETPKKPQAENRGEILARRLNGRVTLEKYPKQGTIVAFRGNKEIFWVELSQLSEVVADFTEIISLQDKKTI